MTLQSALGVYVAAGIIGILIGIGTDGSQGARAVLAAWGICIIVFLRPPARPRVAAAPISSKITRERRIWLGAVPFRLFIVLCGAVLLYSWAGNRLGPGFWIATLVYYLIALALAVAWALAELRT